MAFESLSDKLQNVFKKLRDKGTLTEQDLKEAMRQVRMALLEADVNYKVVKDFCKRVTDKAIGSQVLTSLTPGQQVIKIVDEEMTDLMGSDNDSSLIYGSTVPTVFMMVGLQGAGKTTMSAKLANMLKKKGKKPLLAACDVYRPAAVKQLQVLGDQIDVPVFEMGTEVSPVVIAEEAVEKARNSGCNLVIIDTAGRSEINEDLMQELEDIKKAVEPSEILLTVDAMTGQRAVDVAQGFDQRLDITGVILTKLDGDTRGGAALSIRAVTGKPIKFSGVGEKIGDIEEFHPDRMASRILGMGDVLTLIDKAQESMDTETAKKLSEKKPGEFTLDDYLLSMQQMKKMGGMNSILKMFPGMNQLTKGQEVDESSIKRIEAMILSMTPRERRRPQILDMSRKRRIVRGSGTSIQELNRFLKGYEQVKQMSKQFNGKGGKRRMMNMLGKLGGGSPMGF